MTDGTPILQLKVSLVGGPKPPVVATGGGPANIRLDRLHAVIQAAMGWGDYHIHAFTAGGVDYGLPEPELGHRDERQDSGRQRDQSSRATGCGTSMTSGTTGSTIVVVEKVLVSRARNARTPSASPGKGRRPPRTAAAYGAMRTFARSSPTQPTRSTRTCSNGWDPIRR